MTSKATQTSEYLEYLTIARCLLRESEESWPFLLSVLPCTVLLSSQQRSSATELSNASESRPPNATAVVVFRRDDGRRVATKCRTMRRDDDRGVTTYTRCASALVFVVGGGGAQSVRKQIAFGNRERERVRVHILSDGGTSLLHFQ